MSRAYFFNSYIYIHIYININMKVTGVVECFGFHAYLLIVFSSILD